MILIKYMLLKYESSPIFWLVVDVKSHFWCSGFGTIVNFFFTLIHYCRSIWFSLRFCFLTIFKSHDLVKAHNFVKEGIGMERVFFNFVFLPITKVMILSKLTIWKGWHGRSVLWSFLTEAWFWSKVQVPIFLLVVYGKSQVWSSWFNTIIKCFFFMFYPLQQKHVIFI